MINHNGYRITDTPRRASLYYSAQTEKIPPGIAKRERKIKFRVVFYVTLGMVLVYAVMDLWLFAIQPLFTNVSDQIHYGDSKVFMMGAPVGHGKPGEISRFIAEDNHGEIIVVEVVGKQYTVYTVETITAKEQRVVTLDVKDVNNDGRPNL